MLSLTISTYIDKLVKKYPSILEIWLFGSRANGEANQNSDWDFLIFTDQITFNLLKNDKEFNLPNVDLLVNIDKNGNCFSPFNNKKSNLIEWEWNLINSNEATYKSVKVREAEKITWPGEKEPTQYLDIIKRTLKAIKVWAQ